MGELRSELRVRVYRFDPEKDTAPRYDAYVVPYERGMRILHLLQHIQTHLDPTIAFRYNCAEGICGSCAIRLNGKPVLSCKQGINDSWNEITLEPLLVFPVIKDFVIDFSPAEDKLRSKKQFFIGKQSSEFYTISEHAAELSQEMRKCINCMICYDVCHVLREGHQDYLGPRNIVKIMAQDAHPMNTEERTLLLTDANLSRCNVTRCCSQNCPQEIKITEHAIIPLKEKQISLDDPVVKFLKGVGWIK